jgi:imidazolonepropionase-like amidohydrolase
VAAGVESFKRGYDGRLKMVRAMDAAGVPLAAGTDCTNPHTSPGFSLPVEPELLVGCGLSPAEALRAVTLNPAKFLGAEKTAGTIEAGMRADLVLLDADPLAKIGNVGAVANGPTCRPTS